MTDVRLKPPTTYQQQIDIMRSRGIVISNDKVVRHFLERNSYYRLSGYIFPYLRDDRALSDDLTIESIIRIYEFDRELRLIIMRAIEPVEIYMRTQLSYVFSHIHGPEGHYDFKNFKNKKRHSSFLELIAKQIEDNTDSLFVGHHITKYNGRMPLWVMTEIMSLSTLSKFYSNIIDDSQFEIARKIGQKPDYLGNWLHGLSTLRNRCAHYGRIYNVTLAPAMRLSQKIKKSHQFKNDTLFAHIYALTQLIPDFNKKERMVTDLYSLIYVNTEHIALEQMGFPFNFQEILVEFISK